MDWADSYESIAFTGWLKPYHTSNLYPNRTPLREKSNLTDSPSSWRQLQRFFLELNDLSSLPSTRLKLLYFFMLARGEVLALGFPIVPFFFPVLFRGGILVLLERRRIKKGIFYDVGEYVHTLSINRSPHWTINTSKLRTLIFRQLQQSFQIDALGPLNR